MKQLVMMTTPAKPWVTSPRPGFAAGVRRAIVPAAALPATLGLLADGTGAVRQEKTAFIQARLGKAAFAYRATGMTADTPAVNGRPVHVVPTSVDTANGGVQDSPPWRQPVNP
ncbi:hypothetical protein Sru01_59050 [Sphaerisporangium rufum]|uniref:Uncharacterized protein n=1 Tax=Sphaerisporangium rufum TaxID=1381558 RepID=A0A919V491_9ACTN|nr:hypothetical protein [Sphaerisporangium rufum]GII80923.1 hypothetical protein Sru01_59050 [Sphaerisporangium rufum]